MKRFFRIVLVVSICLGFSLNASAQSDAVTQISTIDALLNAIYDGETTIGQLKQHGDFGLGTFGALDGEMVVLDGTIYQIPYDGKAAQPDLSTTTTPFAVVTFFDSDNRFDLVSGLDYQAVKNKINNVIPTPNIFYAIKITGTFKSVKTRSVPKQSKPYKALKEIVRDQSIFDFQDIEGTILGFLSPPYVKGINVPGYHFHFLTKDRKTGGHVLELIVREAVLEIDEISEFSLILPKDEEFYNVDLTEDKEAELEKVERHSPQK